MSRYESHHYDVIVIGAGGAGLRAAVEVRARGLGVAVICESLLGKAHTVMAECLQLTEEGTLPKRLSKEAEREVRRLAWSCRSR